MTKKDRRIVGTFMRKPKHGHSLIETRKGANRFLPGFYKCQCGKEFISVGAYESHRATRRKEDKKNVKSHDEYEDWEMSPDGLIPSANDNGEMSPEEYFNDVMNRDD